MFSGRSLFSLFALCVSICYSTPSDKIACVGDNVNIPWEYLDEAGMSIVSWEHIDTSNVKTTILFQASGANATSPNGFNIIHNNNGDVTISSATVANTGTYRITVAYTTATPTFTDDVVVNVYDPPTDFNYTESTSPKTFTCQVGSPGDPAADLYIQVNGIDYTTAVSANVTDMDTVKCILSGPAVQCMSGVSGTVKSIDVQTATTKDVTDGPCETGCIVGISIVCGALSTGLMFGICYLCVHLKELGKSCKDIPIWVWILCPFVIGLGILTVWCIWEFCGLKKTCLKDTAKENKRPEEQPMTDTKTDV